MSDSRLLRLFRTRPGVYLGLLGLWIVVRSAFVVSGLLLKELFDALTGSQPAGWNVVTLIALLLALELGRTQLWYGLILNRIEPGYTYGIRSRLRRGVLSDLFARPAGTALNRSTGDALSRLGDDVNEAGVFAIWSASNLSRIVVAIVAIGIMFSLSTAATVGVVVPILIAITIGRMLGARLSRYRAEARESASEVSSLIGEAVGAAQAVKVAGAEARVVGRLRDINRIRARRTVREQVFSTVQETLFTGAAAIGTGLLLLIVAGQLRAGTFTVGDLALFIFYLDFLSEAVLALGMFFVRSKQASLSMGRIAELTASSPSGTTPVESPVATVTGLGYHYPNTAAGIEDVNLTFPQGTVTVITGPVGSGKSTLLRVIMGILPAQQGQVSRPASVAFTSQSPKLFSGSIAENISQGLDADGRRLSAAAEAARLAPDLDGFDAGMDTVVGPRGLRLSGGQLKRVATARMLVREPALLVFDDLSSGLDHETELALWERILAGRTATVIAVSHSRALLRRADQIVLMDNGRVAAVGDYSALGSRLEPAAVDEAPR